MIIFRNDETGTTIESFSPDKWDILNERYHIVRSPLYMYLVSFPEILSKGFLVSDQIKKIEYGNIVFNGYYTSECNVDDMITKLNYETFKKHPEAYIQVYYKFNSKKEYLNWKLKK